MSARHRIHPTAIIDPAAELHETVEVGPYSVIGPNVRVGEGTWIGPHVVLQGPMMVGRRNRIYQFASLGELSQDMTSKQDDDTRVEIGDDNVIREYATIQRGTLKDKDSGGVTRVGNGNWIMNAVHVAHDCQVGNNTIMANNASLAGHVIIEDYVGLGGYTLVHQFCRIGAYAFTGGASVLRRDVPPFVIMQGHPAEPRGVNSEGLRRRGFTAEEIEPIKDAYKLIYLSGVVMSEVKTQLAEMAKTSPHVARMAAFIEQSKRALQR
jgi:UDP-N-acetylglucosamine acyltransferase